MSVGAEPSLLVTPTLYAVPADPLGVAWILKGCPEDLLWKIYFWPLTRFKSGSFTVPFKPGPWKV